MGKRCKKTVLILTGIVFIVILCSVLILSFMKEDVVALSSVYEFTENNLPLFGISDEEKDEINRYLENHYVLDNGFYLLVNNDYSVFEKIYASYSVLKAMDSPDNEQVIEKLIGIFRECEQNITNYGIPAYDYTYYLAIKSELNESVDRKEYEEILTAYIDDDTGLFYYMVPTEDIDTKLLISAKIASLCDKYDIDISGFDLYGRLTETCEEYKFVSKEEGQSLYNSGGTLIYALRNCREKYPEDTDMTVWFNKWKEYYSDFNIHDEISYIEFYSYYQVSRFFEAGEPEKIKEYIMDYDYSDLDASSFELIDIKDYFIDEFSDILTDKQKNDISEFVHKKVMEIEESITNDVDIASTFYGSSLAYQSGFDMDFEACRDTVGQMYENTMNDMNSEDFVYNTYYYVMFMNSFEIKPISDDVKTKINKRLDEIISEIVETDDVDIGMLRRCLEIKSNMLSYVFEDSYNKIKNIIRNIIEENKFNSRIIDVVKIDGILKTGLVNQEYFDRCKKELYAGGGYRCRAGEEPDLKTTYLMYTLLTNHDIVHPTNEEIEDMYKFVESLNRNGLYRYEVNDGYTDIRSVYYGYVLKRLSIGDKYETDL